ncbi:copper resistance protein NlpE N-terminal domain-containing protein [Dyadobacter jiangsuensis]|uniref:NlpE-like protein n=1 Tax=Dyadobacter jiangsuensis TaxID=1591085 RepID=A0A2P8FZZ1_9BACT|nr:copper resistance protein NlpE N-terminal domain-containing protein [Dyadobacter jiangsuensis]PSL27279.1 NlpE-like protein [Dyadobacter jiangsuensis]
MKRSIRFSLLLLMGWTALGWTAPGWVAPAYLVSPEPEVFVAATPCDAVPRHLLAIPDNLDCEMIKWRLTLRRDPRNLGRDDFKLQYTYGITKPGTQGFMNDGFSKEISGKWVISGNTGKTPGKQIFTLEPTASESKITLLQMSDRMLHLLDTQGNLMIGNAGFSYTFNKQNANL